MGALEFPRTLAQSKSDGVPGPGKIRFNREPRIATQAYVDYGVGGDDGLALASSVPAGGVDLLVSDADLNPSAWVLYGTHGTHLLPGYFRKALVPKAGAGLLKAGAKLTVEVRPCPIAEYQYELITDTTDLAATAADGSRVAGNGRLVVDHEQPQYAEWIAIGNTDVRGVDLTSLWADFNVIVREQMVLQFTQADDPRLFYWCQALESIQDFGCYLVKVRYCDFTKPAATTTEMFPFKRTVLNMRVG